MKLITHTPKDSFSDILQKYKPVNTDFDKFKAQLQTFIDKTDVKESEEHLKNNLRDFLRGAFYQPEYEINTKGKQDLAIHLGKTIDKNVGVIFETKKPTNIAEMITAENPNRRALHELVYYYFDERTEAKNFELKRLIISDFQKWFVFDANAFDKYFYNNTEIRKLYENTVKENKGKQFFYGELTKIFDNSADEIPCAYFDFIGGNTHEVSVSSVKENALTNVRASASFIELYKTLSPAFLLKAEIADDSNALKKPFYYELLHIIGLEETKDKSKVKINRKAAERRSDGALIELAIGKLESEYSIFPDQEKLKEFGETKDERIYNIALELCIVWINRILFLKLLEAQLVNYHQGNRDYYFLNAERIPTFNELYNLFHEVLAKQSPERIARVKDKFALVPYLNSSLFDFADIERLTIRISAIDDNVALEFAPNTALKELKSKPLDTLEYLFRFLDRHDFASVENTEELRDAERPIINASVLGKIFEKINGYKDGSIYTPGFITMYMCRQAIRLAVVQKFNESYADWSIETFAGLKNRLAKYDEPHKILEFNEIINSIKLCDPAVGSGHFLVSALNEIIAVKHELGLLADTEGNRFYDYNVSIVADELDITDRHNKPFKYEITDGKPNPKAHRFQKTLFHEKQMLIENCLFGVDINPNSVKICRLRLWIELLKNAYYKNVQSPNFSLPPASEARREHAEARTLNFTELETLPNIDINIKEGNSLISRFALDADLRDALKTVKYSVEDYRNKVFEYKNERNRDVKTELLKVIEQIKADFRTEIYKHHPKVIELLKKERRLFEINSPSLFDKYSEGERETLSHNLEKQIADLKTEIEAVKSNKIYKNAFEWRFEFPEVLDNDGNFQGFDIVIGNPPYIRHEELGELKTQLKKDYTVFTGMADILVYFYELGLRVLKQNGSFSFITSNKFMRANYGKALREFLRQYNLYEIIDFGELPVFEEAATFPVIVNLTKDKNDECVRFTQVKTLNFDSLESLIKETSSILSASAFADEKWTLADSHIVNLIEKITKTGVPLKKYLTNCEIRYGIKTGFNEAFVIDEEKRNELIANEPKANEFIKPFIIGDDIRKWNLRLKNRWLIYIPWHFPLHKEKIEGASKKAELEFQQQFPKIYEHLEKYKPQLKARNKAETDIHYEWYALQRFGATYWEDFNKPKILFPDIAKESRMTFVDHPLYVGNTAYFIPTEDKYLLAILNSKVVFFFYSKIAAVLGDADKGGRLRWIHQDVIKIPIPEISPEEQKPFIKLVDEILALKKAGAETIELEDKIDAMVFDLYELDEAERDIVRGKL